MSEEQIKDLMDGLFKGLERNNDEKPDLVSEQQHKNQDRINREHEERKNIDPFPGVGMKRI